MSQGAMGLRILGRRQVTHRKENDHVWLYDESRRKSGQGRVWVPPSDVNQAEGGEGWSGLRRVE